jgi:hypothetical protein
MLERPAALVKENGAGRGEVNVTAVALEQRDPELVLEPSDLLAKGGLRDVESLGRAAEMQLLSDGNEVLDESQVEPFHRRSLLIRGQRVLDLAPPRVHALRHGPTVVVASPAVTVSC